MNKSSQYLYQWLQIDKKQFLKNVELIRHNIADDIAAVVKGNGYGHHMDIATSLFMEAGIKRFCTYHPKNAVLLRRQHPGLQLMAMGPVQLNEIEEVFEAGVELFVWDASFVDYLIKQSGSFNFKASIHLEVETGMFRTGIPMEDVPTILEKVSRCKNLHVKGICTHFSGADETDNEARIQEQFSNWKRLRKEIEGLENTEYEWHGTNTSASLSLQKESFSYARIGLLLYGFFSSKNNRNAWPKDVERPKPAISFKSRVCGKNIIPKGKYSGYGLSWKADETTASNIIPVGYHDGFTRKLSNKWKVKVNEDLYQAIGRINMNLTVFKGSKDQSMQQSEVTIFNQEPPFDWYEACERGDLFIYELLCTLPTHLPRIVVE